MKYHLHRSLRLLRRDAISAARFLREWMLLQWPLALVILTGTLLAVWLLLPADASAAAAVQRLNAQSPDWKLWARRFSYYGDFLGLNVGLFLLLQIAGWSLRSRRLLRIAVASFLCAVCTGLTANVVRFATGRPRPSEKMADGLYGPSFRSGMQSLPSAHTATALGGTLPVLMAHPLLGLPLTGVGVAVGWSRVQMNRHHVTDITFSAGLALIYALPFSSWCLGRRPRLQRMAVREPSPADALNAS